MYLIDLAPELLRSLSSCGAALKRYRWPRANYPTETAMSANYPYNPTANVVGITLGYNEDISGAMYRK